MILFIVKVKVLLMKNTLATPHCLRRRVFLTGIHANHNTSKHVSIKRSSSFIRPKCHQHFTDWLLEEGGGATTWTTPYFTAWADVFFQRPQHLMVSRTSTEAPAAPWYRPLLTSTNSMSPQSPQQPLKWRSKVQVDVVRRWKQEVEPTRQRSWLGFGNLSELWTLSIIQDQLKHLVLWNHKKYLYQFICGTFIYQAKWLHTYLPPPAPEVHVTLQLSKLCGLEVIH